ncbi:MAG: glycosyltransferase family 2 protein [Alphaproteobacteria bacterium]
MTHEKNATAIIVTYNSADVITRCIERVLAAPEIAEVIVVDNCGVDDTCDIIRKHFPTVKVIENPKNEGFGRANNVGLGKVKTDYALLINPDAVLEKDTLTLLVEVATKYTDAAILAPALYDEQGVLHKSFKQNVFDREKDKADFILPEADICADFLSGAVWLCNMKHLRTIGFFDKNIFLYYEDDDLCLRVRKAGLGLVYVPQARAVHMMGASSGASNAKAEYFKQQHLIFSRLYIEEKYHGVAAAKKLAKKLNLEYAAKASFYTLFFNKAKINRYRGRIAGVFEFGERK